jgi:DNA-3-methyladenine glycosylase II
MSHNQKIFTDTIMQSLYEQVYAVHGDLPLITAAQPEKHFGHLVESIISQQLSTKVADIIAARALALSGGTWDPSTVLAIEHETLRSAGLSNSKVLYIKNIAQAWTDKTIVPTEFNNLSDEEIITQLVTIKGVGRWTAEMFLIFCLGRTDVFSAGDFGLRKAISAAYNLPMTTKPAELLVLSQQWQPHRSLASRVLWKSLELAQ